MISARTKVCPRCAERVRVAAEVCRYCGHEFGDAPAIGPGATKVPNQLGSTFGRLVLAAACLLLVILAGWAMVPRVDGFDASGTEPGRVAKVMAPVAAMPRVGPELSAGETLEWIAGKSPGDIVRQVGPLVVRISRRVEDDTVAPVVTVSRTDEAVTMVGEFVSEGYTHRISAVRNVAGAMPVIMLQSFSGGAHCCNHVQLAGLSNGRLKVIDLGSSDGEERPLPSDLSGDGVADFVGHDDAFLYAFAPYAMSYAPPTVSNVIGGRVVDVSKGAAFRRLYMDEVASAGETCRNGSSGVDRNGACPSYVAAAARVGQLGRAWDDMVRSYAADEEWQLPSGCAVRTKAECPEPAVIVYKSYPEALLAFLKDHGYVPADWSPSSTPDAVTPDQGAG